MLARAIDADDGSGGQIADREARGERFGRLHRAVPNNGVSRGAAHRIKTAQISATGPGAKFARAPQKLERERDRQDSIAPQKLERERDRQDSIAIRHQLRR